MGYVVSVDTGGTFTDTVLVDEDGSRTTGKASTTPDDPSEGVLASVTNASEDYKEHALSKTMAMEEAGPLMNDPADYVDDEMEFRQYYCPGCATLLENEVILAELDPIHDRELT